MIGYLLLILALVFFSIRKQSVSALLLVFSFLFLFSALRYNIGWDYSAYIQLMKSQTQYEFNRLENEIEPFSYFLLKFAQEYGYYYFFIFSSFITVYGYYKGIRSESANPMLSVWVYVAMPLFMMTNFSIIRNGMAYSFVFWALAVYMNKRFYQIILIIIGALFHQSALIGLLILLPWHKVGLKSLTSMVLVSIVIGEFFFSAFMHFLVRIIHLPDLFLYYLSGEVEQSGGSVNRLLLYLLCFLCLVNYSVFSKSVKYRYFISLFCVGVSICALFSSFSHVSIRLSLYFVSSLLLIIPYLCVEKKIKMGILYFVSLVLFISSIYYLHISMYNILTGDSPVYPYKSILSLIL